MAENFDDDFKKEYNDEEYQEAFFDSLTSTMMNIFEILKASEPVLAKAVESDYQEFMKHLVDYFGKHKTVDGSLNYILSQSPNNLWAEIIAFIAISQLREYQNNPQEGEKAYREVLEHLKNLIKKRREGKNIQ